MDVALLVALSIMTAIAVVMSWRMPNAIRKAANEALEKSKTLQQEALSEAVNSPQQEG